MWKCGVSQDYGVGMSEGMEVLTIVVSSTTSVAMVRN